MSNNQLSLILASTSPRRKQLLTDAGYNFTSTDPTINESDFSSKGLAPSEFAALLALAKAKSIAQKYPNNIVIGADTVADFNGQIIGKPTDAEHAEQITRKLFSAPHKVITAVAIVRQSDNTQITQADITTVYPKKLTDRQIAEHINSQSWQGKAGAYAIQETGDEFIERIEGSLTNVMGLPMELLSRMLENVAI